MLFYLLHSPLMRGWFAVVVRSLSPSNIYKDATSLLVVCTPFSVCKYVGIPSGSCKWSKKRFAMCVCVEVVLKLGIARTFLE